MVGRRWSLRYLYEVSARHSREILAERYAEELLSHGVRGWTFVTPWNLPIALSLLAMNFKTSVPNIMPAWRFDNVLLLNRFQVLRRTYDRSIIGCVGSVLEVSMLQSQHARGIYWFSKYYNCIILDNNNNIHFTILFWSILCIGYNTEDLQYKNIYTISLSYIIP